MLNRDRDVQNLVINEACTFLVLGKSTTAAEQVKTLVGYNKIYVNLYIITKGMWWNFAVRFIL